MVEIIVQKIKAEMCIDERLKALLPYNKRIISLIMGVDHE